MREPLATIRRMLLGLLVLELIGTGVELLFLSHFEDVWQLVPLALIVLALGILAWHAAARSATSIHALRATMVLAIVSAGIGFALHFRANAEFQLDIDPSASGPALWMKVLRAKAPPALAPGVMAHLGLLGLAYTYRHPALRERINPFKELVMKRLISAAAALVILFMVATAANGQVGKSLGIIDPNVAAEKDLLALPHMTPAIVKGRDGEAAVHEHHGPERVPADAVADAAAAERVLRQGVRPRQSEHRRRVKKSC